MSAPIEHSQLEIVSTERLERELAAVRPTPFNAMRGFSCPEHSSGWARWIRGVGGILSLSREPA